MEWLKGKSYQFESCYLLILLCETIPHPLKTINFHLYVELRVRPGRSSNSPCRSPREGLTGGLLPSGVPPPARPALLSSPRLPLLPHAPVPAPLLPPRSRHRSGHRSDGPARLPSLTPLPCLLPTAVFQLLPVPCHPSPVAEGRATTTTAAPSTSPQAASSPQVAVGDAGGEGGHAARNCRGPTLAAAAPRGGAGARGSGQVGLGGGSSEETAAAAAMADYEAGVGPKARRAQGNHGRGERGEGAVPKGDPQAVAPRRL